MKNKNVYLEPMTIKNNSYCVNLIDNLGLLGFQCKSTKAFWKKEILHKLFNNIFIFSWLEDLVAQPSWIVSTKVFFQTIIKLLLLKMMFNKVIWIRHNYYPHQLSNSHVISKYYHLILVYILEKCSSFKLAHSDAFCTRNPDFLYLPHPIYPCENPNHDIERPTPFLIFGRLMRYKGVLELLEVWPSHLPLAIKGKPEDSEYRQELEALILKRNLVVSVEFEFLSAPALEKALQETEYVIVTNSENTMIASGVVVHALSFGCSVLAINNSFVNELVDKGLPIRAFNSFLELASLASNPKGSINKNNFNLIEKEFGPTAVTSVLSKVLND
jgi:beta-1,4-mannosyltransferase